MIDLYTWSTPNGRKVSIMLEECGLQYAAHAIDISKGDQFKPEFLKISPNNRIPAIIDRDNGQSLFESGAILMYLAQKTGKFWPKDGPGHWQAVEWLMWQMGGVGPMLGPGAPLREIQPGQGALRRGALPDGGAPALRRARPAPSAGRVSRRQLFDRRHGHLALDLALRVADRRYEQVSQRAALVQGDRGAPGGSRRAITFPSSSPAFRCRPEAQSKRATRVSHGKARRLLRRYRAGSDPLRRGRQSGCRPLRRPRALADAGGMHGAGAVRHHQRSQLARSRRAHGAAGRAGGRRHRCRHADARHRHVLARRYHHAHAARDGSRAAAAC